MMHTPARTHEMSLERARLAARHAAQAHLNALDESEKSNAPGNGLAVLTWGAMAMACSLAAAVTIALPLVDDDWIGSNKLAKNETSSLEAAPTDATIEPTNLDPSITDDLLDSDEPALEELAATVPEPTAPMRVELKTTAAEPFDKTTVAAIRPSETVVSPASVLDQVASNPVLVEDGLTVSIPLPESAVNMDLQLNALKRRAPGLFDAKFMEADETGDSLTVGPFSTPSEIARFCRTVKLSLTLDCKAG
ncbi:MAG: hypothetical protein AAF903_10715 [Pseudomonadota bacterium]